MTADEIYQLGKRYLKELKEERARLAEKIAPGKPVEKVLKQIQEDAPNTFEEVLELTRKEVKRAQKFLTKKDIATVDERDVTACCGNTRLYRSVNSFCRLVAPRPI